MAGGEGFRGGAAREVLKNRGFELDEVVFAEVGAQGGDEPRPQQEGPARFLVCQQVELALAVAGLDVRDAVEEVWRVAQSLGQHRALANRQRQLPALGHVEIALDADHVGQVEGVDSTRSEEHTSELQSQFHLVCRLLLEKKNTKE